MGTYAEYLQKSNQLFRIIGGKFSIPQEMILGFKEEFKNLLYETALRDGYPVGTSKDLCRDPISDGYMFVMEQKSFTSKEREAAGKFFAQNFDRELKDTGDRYIGNLAATKFRRRRVILTKNPNSIGAIDLINELFYKTPPVLVMTVDGNGKPTWPDGRSPIRTVPHSTEGGAIAKKSAEPDDLPTSSWDTLD